MKAASSSFGFFVVISLSVNLGFLGLRVRVGELSWERRGDFDDSLRLYGDTNLVVDFRMGWELSY